MGAPPAAGISRQVRFAAQTARTGCTRWHCGGRRFFGSEGKYSCLVCSRYVLSSLIRVASHPMPHPRLPARPEPPSKGAGPPRSVSRARLQCRVAVEIAAAFTGVASHRILSAQRFDAPVSRARHLAMYLAHVAFQLRFGVVGEGFGRDRKSVVYAVARIEDARDDDEFDRQLTQLERLAVSCRQLSGEGEGE